MILANRYALGAGVALALVLTVWGYGALQERSGHQRAIQERELQTLEAIREQEEVRDDLEALSDDDLFDRFRGLHGPR